MTQLRTRLTAIASAKAVDALLIGAAAMFTLGVLSEAYIAGQRARAADDVASDAALARIQQTAGRLPGDCVDWSGYMMNATLDLGVAPARVREVDLDGYRTPAGDPVDHAVIVVDGWRVMDGRTNSPSSLGSYLALGHRIVRTLTVDQVWTMTPADLRHAPAYAGLENHP